MVNPFPSLPILLNSLILFALMFSSDFLYFLFAYLIFVYTFSLLQFSTSVPRSPGSSRPGTPTRRFDRPSSRPPSRSQTPISHYEDSHNHSNDSWNDRRQQDRRPNKPNVFDRLGGRASESRQPPRDR